MSASIGSGTLRMRPRGEPERLRPPRHAEPPPRESSRRLGPARTKLGSDMPRRSRSWRPPRPRRPWHERALSRSRNRARRRPLNGPSTLDGYAAKSMSGGPFEIVSAKRSRPVGSGSRKRGPSSTKQPGRSPRSRCGGGTRTRWPRGPPRGRRGGRGGRMRAWRSRVPCVRASYPTGFVPPAPSTGAKRR